MTRLIFTITIFASAFLLFLVQPMIGKLILPKLGGTPQVWNTCMVFFQMTLLVGYGYSHLLTTKLKIKQTLMLHCAILIVPIATLLLFPMYHAVQDWSPPTEGSPIPNTLGLLALIIGIPFLLASTSAPILIRWFAFSGDKDAKDPYFLYAVSNLGSLSALFFYPALEEPFVILPQQTHIWVGGFVTLVALIVCCAITIFKHAPDESVETAAAPPLEAAPTPAAPAPPVTAAEASTAVKSGPAPGLRGIQRKKGRVPGKLGEDHGIPEHVPSIVRGANAPMTPFRRLRWILLAAVPSSLMLGVTSYISTDLSPFPLVWIIPLALYLLSFIFVFMKGWTGRRFQVFGPPGYTLHNIVLYVGQPLGLLTLCIIVLGRSFDPFWATSGVMFGFFMNALACHGEMADDRPDPKHLTEFFLMMSIGGAVGGIFNGIFAPIVFQGGVYEFYIVLVVACLVRTQYVPSGWFDELIMQAFPGFRTWVTGQGDEMSKSMGRPVAGTTYLFSFFLDIVFGLFIMCLAWWLKYKAFEPGSELVSRIAKFTGLSPRISLQIFVYFIPLTFCMFFSGRPLRFGLAVAGMLYGSMYLAEREDERSALIEARRTYFGILRVMRGVESCKDREEADFFSNGKLPQREGQDIAPSFEFTYLMHGTTYHGRNYIYDPESPRGKAFKDLSRLATTYYHRYGPVGIVMEQDNYLPGKQNTFYTDLHTPVSMVGQIASALGTNTTPLGTLVATWSDAPFATIGLGTGTMVSYAHPYQHMTYYEIDEAIRGFSLPENKEGGQDYEKEAYFTYLQSAVRRGINAEVIMGDARQSLGVYAPDDARQSMQKDREARNLATSFVYFGNFGKADPKQLNKGRAYARVPYDMVHRQPGPNDTPNMSAYREKYYKYINVDAFSSDAIPVHLITLQAIKLYMSKLRDDGVLCVHTSNRHMDLVRPVARIALELGLGCKVGKDGAEKERFMGHFSSEYVMIYHKDGPFEKFLEKLSEEKDKLGNAPPPDGRQILNAQVIWYDPYKDHTEFRGGRPVKAPITKSDPVWTDDYSHILSVLR